MKDLSRYKKITGKFLQNVPVEPVKIKPFVPETKQIAQKYKKKLDRLLSGFNLEARIHGSVAFEIAGKGEIDFRIFVPTKRWLEIVKYFINYYRRVENLEDEYVRFVDFFDGLEIEVVLVRGYTALHEKRLSKYFKNHSEARNKYEEIKRKYAYSRREYIHQKYKFLKSISFG